MQKITGNMGLVGFEKGTVKTRVWIATVFFILASIGAVILVDWGVEKIQNSRFNKKAEIATATPRNDNQDNLSIAGAGSEGPVKIWSPQARLGEEGK